MEHDEVSRIVARKSKQFLNESRKLSSADRSIIEAENFKSGGFTPTVDVATGCCLKKKLLCYCIINYPAHSSSLPRMPTLLIVVVSWTTRQ